MFIKINRFNIYFVTISLLVLLPVDFKKSIVNHTYIFNLRLDYILHSLLFSPWFFFKPAKINKHFIWFLIGFLLGSSIECLQYFVPYRTFNLKDILANFLGLCAGTILGLWLELVIKKSKNMS
jgi:VanZ family protein